MDFHYFPRFLGKSGVHLIHPHTPSYVQADTVRVPANDEELLAHRRLFHRLRVTARRWRSRARTSGRRSGMVVNRLSLKLLNGNRSPF